MSCTRGSCFQIGMQFFGGPLMTRYKIAIFRKHAGVPIYFSHRLSTSDLYLLMWALHLVQFENRGALTGLSLFVVIIVPTWKLTPKKILTLKEEHHIYDFTRGYYVTLPRLVPRWVADITEHWTWRLEIVLVFLL